MGIKQAVTVVTGEGVPREHVSWSKDGFWSRTFRQGISAAIWTILDLVERLSLLSGGRKYVFVPLEQLEYDFRVHGFEAHGLRLLGEAVVDQRECREVEFLRPFA